DIDTGDTLTLSTGTLPGWLHFDASTGTFTGTPTNGDVGTTPVTVTATDSHGASVSTTFDLVVNNTNDAPLLKPIVKVFVDEDGTTVTGQLHASDPDVGDHLSYSLARPVSGLTLDANGSWSFDPGHADYQHLHEGQQQTLSIPITVTDSAGARDTQDLVIHLTGTNDAPVLSLTQTSHATGTLQQRDIDTGDTHTFSTTAGTGLFGNLTVDPDTGAYSYTQNPSVAGMALDKATGNYSGTDVFEVQVTDHQGGVDTLYVSFHAQAQVSAPVTPGGQPTIITSVPGPAVITTSMPATSSAVMTPPVNNVTIDLAVSSDSGQSQSDNLTRDTTPTLTGTTDIPFSRVDILDGNRVVATTTSDASGHYRVDSAALTDGTHNLVAEATAPSATQAVSSGTLDINIDTTAPVPTLAVDAITADNVINAYEAGGSVDVTGTVGGEFNAGDSVTLSVNGSRYTGAVDAAGKFSIAVPGSDLAAGSQVQASVSTTDAAGNSASTSLDHGYAVDTGAPALTVNAVALTNDNTPDITGTTDDPGATIRVSVGGHTYTATNHGDGTWTLPGSQLTSPIPDGASNPIAVTATDAVGNSAQASATAAIDTTPSGQPTIVTPVKSPMMTSSGAHGQFGAVDPDIGDQLQWGAQDIGQQHPSSGSTSGHYGTFTIDPHTGTWNYQTDQNRFPQNSAGSFTDSFLVKVTDQQGNTDYERVDIVGNYENVKQGQGHSFGNVHFEAHITHVDTSQVQDPSLIASADEAQESDIEEANVMLRPDPSADVPGDSSTQGSGSPLDDYLQFASPAPATPADETAPSPLSDYLDSAGVDTAAAPPHDPGADPATQDPLLQPDVELHPAHENADTSADHSVDVPLDPDIQPAVDDQHHNEQGV
ncbi:Ig-like domain-containing protein, partial [Marinobacterium nitratireducens]|uniref:Ig-like domain-containing protein n=1 Tax=Marinobacterium nitratireducens TaxID=518897 RepID=UPI001667556E